MISPLLKRVSAQSNIEAAWRTIQENGRTSTSKAVREEIDDFSEDAGNKIRSLCHRLSRSRFEFGQAKGIPIPKRDAKGTKTGKFRPIVLASVEARIVQRALLNVLLSLPQLEPYIQTPYSFGGLKKKKTPEPTHKKDNPSAVPAAIKAVLDAIENGACFYAAADIKSFFTRISKPEIIGIISREIAVPDFTAFFEKAITTELHNIAELRDLAKDFPIEEIGVAQGNSLSPLIGNMVLAEFDRLMNEGDCRCIRYIDDFIILAPTARAAKARLRKATDLLKAKGMELSPEKSSKSALPITDGIEFLGIEIKPGVIRPADKAQKRIVQSVSSELIESQKAFREVSEGKRLPRKKTLISALKRVDGMIDGWGKHYWFCNDNRLFQALDKEIAEQIRSYLGAYANIRRSLPLDNNNLLGIAELEHVERFPFAYPKTSASHRKT